MAISDNLISYWKLDEASGNAVDSHGSNTLTETSGTIGSASGLPLGNARDFEAGDTEYFDIADNASLSTGDIDFSFAAWVRGESMTGNNVVIAGKWSGNNTSSEWKLEFLASGGTDKFRFVKTSGSTTVAVVANTFGFPSNATNYYVAGGHNASTNEIWISVNGGSINTASTSTGVNDGTLPFQIGATNGGNYWDGLIGQAGFWKRDIRSDLASLYNGGSGLAYPFGGTAYTLDSSAGSFAHSGNAASLLLGVSLLASKGTHVLSGGTAGSIIRSLCSAGPHSLTGGSAFSIIRVLSGSGNYTLTGNDADVGGAVILDAAGGAYTHTGNPASLPTLRLIAAGSGQYAVVGTDADLCALRMLLGETGPFVFTGGPATFTGDGPVVRRPVRLIGNWLIRRGL